MELVLSEWWISAIIPMQFFPQSFAIHISVYLYLSHMFAHAWIASVLLKALSWKNWGHSELDDSDDCGRCHWNAKEKNITQVIVWLVLLISRLIDWLVYCLVDLSVAGSSHSYTQMNGPGHASHSNYAAHTSAIWPQWGHASSDATSMQAVVPALQHSQQSVGQMSTHSRLIQSTGNQSQKELSDMFGLLDGSATEFSDLSGMFNGFS